MSERDNDFINRLLLTFKVEAREHVNAMVSNLLELEKASTPEKQKEVIEVLFREAHSLKGAARAVNLDEIERTCQEMEGVFAALKRKELTPSSELLDVLHQVVDSLGVLLRSTQVEQATSRKTPIRELLRRLGRTSKGPPLPSKQATKETEVEPVDREPQTHESLVEQKPSQLETIRISTARLDSILLQAEEMVSAKLAASQRITDLRGIGAALVTWKKEWTKIQAVVRTIQQSLEGNGQHNGSKRNQQTTRLVEFLEWNNTFVKSMEGQLSLLTRTAEQDRRLLTGMVDDLLNDMKRVLMLPFSSVLEIFPKLVRDLSRNQAKQVELLIQGGEIEVDRRILEEMKDPLIHLVRNCIDHGIEKPEERKRQKKSPQGTVRIAISQKNGSRVEILISDDGAGIDLVKVKSAALKLGTVSQEEAERLGDKETLSLVFQPELSTSPIITDISGRGLGLAIVQEKVEKLGGGVSLATQPDRGTTLRIDLPLTLARFRGILVLVEGHLFVLPTSLIQCVARVKAEEIKTVGNRETIQLHGQALSLVRLKDVLDLSRTSGSNHSKEAVPLLVLGSAENRIAFLVDEIIGEQEVLVKGLGKQLSRVRNIAGATILGAGRVVPILNVPDLLKSAVKIVAAPSRVATEIDQGQTARKSVLIVEDSITARTLLKNILEAAGYSVKAAVDGVDALTALKSESVDLVVSDVEMPRMDGFELTAKIRASTRLSELPVVLVTALESREDRERGIDVGASAYIVKSSFDQGNLLEIIGRLI